MIEPGKFDLKISTRASYRHKWTFMEPQPDPAPPAPIDFTDCEARAEIRPAPESDTIYISVNEIANEQGYLIIDGPAGEIDIYLSVEATAVLAGVRKASWDLFVEWPNGEDVDKVLKGRVIIDPSVTDPTYD
jgi:hypothetical protein